MSKSRLSVSICAAACASAVFFGALIAQADTAAKAVVHPVESFFDLYANNRHDKVPNYITSDFILLSYSLIRARTLKEVEGRQARPLLAQLLGRLKKSQAVGDDKIGQANQRFLNVLETLLSGVYPAKAAKPVTDELGLILAARSMSRSPLWGLEIDYTQFQPRGRYTESPKTANYFRALRYAGAILFPIKESQATGVTGQMADQMTAQAIRFVQAIEGNKDIKDNYRRLNTLFEWMMGPADDLVNSDLAQNSASQAKQTLAARRAALLDQARKQDRQPRIISARVNISALEKGVTVRDVMTGWRLLPQRYSPESAVFQQLVYDQVTDYIDDCKTCAEPFGIAIISGRKVKGFPSAYELMALLGSQAAKHYIADHRQNHFKGYVAASSKATGLLKGVPGLPGAHLGLMRTALIPQPSSKAQDHRLTSMLGFWTWQRYLSVLYAKQSYTLTGKGLKMDAARPGAGLEPSTALYQALENVVNKHRKIAPHSAWEQFGKVLAQCIAISQQEAKGKALVEKDVSFLNGLDRRLLELTGMKDHPIVVDVHSNPASGQVVEEALGWPKIVEKQTGKAVKARGARFSHYEFKQPIDKRLTDAQWMAKLKKVEGVKH